MNIDLSILRSSLRSELVTWVRTLLEDVGTPHLGPLCKRCLHVTCQTIRHGRAPEDTIEGMSRWLLGRIERIRQHPEGHLMVDGLCAIIDAIERSVDRPTLARHLPCPSPEECGGHIRVTADTIHARCDTCEWETYDLPWLGRMLRGNEPSLVTGIDACHRLLVEGTPVSPSSIRKWVERGKVAVHGRDERGRNLYDLEEVRDTALAVVDKRLPVSHHVTDHR